MQRSESVRLSLKNPVAFYNPSYFIHPVFSAGIVDLNNIGGYLNNNQSHFLDGAVEDEVF